MTRDPVWTEYYEQNEGREPREMLLQTLDRFDGDAGSAVDLGCGSGIDTLAMLERGWSVFASDANEEAIDRLRARVPPGLAGRLRVEVASMERVVLPEVDLTWAGFCLFFCEPERFDEVWRKVVRSVRRGGRFAGHLLGDRDTWAPQDGISSFSREQALERLAGFTIERFDEEENDGSACSGPKHWHVFHVVARRPTSTADPATVAP